MKEGWSGDKHLIVFEDDEARIAADRYGLSKTLPGFVLVGLNGWDDLLVRDASGRLFSVPAVPCVPEQLEAFPEALLSAPLQEDRRFTGKIKWYIKPLVFGGAPQDADNMTWVSHEQHGALVRWWNDVYRSVAPEQGR